MTAVLFVCTANICRSPAAEAIARSRFPGAEYSSAGFLFEGRAIERDMARALGRIGVDASSHRSRIVDEDLAERADLILTMESRHVQDLALLSHEIFTRAIPLAEAAERLGGRPRPASQFVSELVDRDPLVYLDQRWDVEDPHGKSGRKYRQTVDQISQLVDAVLGGLS